MYAASHGSRPVSLGASLLISGGILTALVFVSPGFVPKEPPPPLIAGTIEAPKPPPPEPEPEPQPRTETVRDTPIVAPIPEVRTETQPDVIRTTSDPVQPPPTPYVGKPEGTAEVVTPPTPPLPPLIAAQADPRYAGDIQPPYPAARERAGDEGNVRVRIRIGSDGRVKEVIQLSATHSDFWEATRRHVLARWRFKPATRGGVPEESWKVMSLKFEIKG